jgi:glycosyltransferase involved in cell wall biosynthesis
MSRIDVIIPVRDIDTWLNEAVASVLAQERVEVTITVVDAGSVVPVRLGPEVLGDGRVQLVRSDVPLFAGAARNLGVARGTSALLGFLDADDLWPPDRCWRLADLLAASNADLVVGSVEEFGQREGAVPGVAHLAGGGLMRRSAFERVGGHDPNLATGEWVDLMARARHQGLVEVAGEVLALRRRIHGSSTTVARRDLRDDYLKVVRAQLARREAPDD